MSCNATLSRKHSDKWTARVAKNGSRPKGKFGYKFVVYCPDCLPKAITIAIGVRRVTCPNGHQTEVRW